MSDRRQRRPSVRQEDLPQQLDALLGNKHAEPRAELARQTQRVSARPCSSTTPATHHRITSDTSPRPPARAVVYLADLDCECSEPACWSEGVADDTEDLRSTGDDTIEGVVAGVLFAEFAAEVGFDYVLQTAIDCDPRSLQDYGQCIADLEGKTSATFSALRRAAEAYGVALDAMPPGDWSYCNAGYVCGSGQGDCDSDADCLYGTTCISNVGADYGWSSAVDVCEATLYRWWSL